MQSLKQFFILLIFMVLGACIGTRQLTSDQLAGQYHDRHGAFGHAVLDLKSDTTFSYQLLNCEINDTVHGTWAIAGKQIQLKPDIHPSEKTLPDYEVLHQEFYNQDSLTIFVFGQDSQGLEFANCILTQQEQFLVGGITNEQGRVALRKSHAADRLTIVYLGHKTIRFPIIDWSFDHYILRMTEHAGKPIEVPRTLLYKKDGLYEMAADDQKYIRAILKKEAVPPANTSKGF